VTDSMLTIGSGLVVNDWTPKAITFPLDGKVLFVIKADGTIERGEGFTTEDEMSLHFWEMIEKMGMLRVPKGWQIVPIQPTPEMLDVADIPRIAAIGVWSNMLKAAPLP
jgi:hypothetical protein